MLLMERNKASLSMKLSLLLVLSSNGHMPKIVVMSQADNANVHYMLSPIRLSVCNVRVPYSASWNFRQYFYAIWYLGHTL